MLSESDVRHSRLFTAMFGALVCLFFAASPILAEENIDVAPVLISEANSTRALTAAPAGGGLNINNRVFQPGAKTSITVFITNVKLINGEGAAAFRADATDGRYFRFPLRIVSLVRNAERPWVYALTFKLHAGMGDVGDVLLRVNWRGMASNRVRLAIGHEGGGLPDDEGAVPTPMPETEPLFVQPDSAGLPYTGDRVRFMEQATFGPNPTLESRLRRIGYLTWLNEQMSVRRELPDSLLNLPLMADNVSPTCTGNCIRDNYTMYPLQNWFFKEALYGEDQQLRRRVAWALHQILVVSGRETVQPSRMVPYFRILDTHAFGNYRKLLEELTLNPAMGNYLDMAISTKQNPNENYAREILQLFSIGTDMLNQDGTPKLDGQGNPIPSYTQDTVNNFTKIFTGWTFCNSPSCEGHVNGTRNFKAQMVLNQANHDETAKQLLNYTGAVFSVIPAGQAGMDDLKQALDNISNHPNVAPFISKLLIQQLVTSNPTPAYVKRVADVFSANRDNPTQLREVIRAILLDPEARGNNKTDPDYGHLKEPMLYVTNVLRALNPTANTTAQALCGGLSDGVINGVTVTLDQDIFNPPSVFNYYSMDYSLPNTNLVAPEFAILTTGTALKRPNVINQFLPPASAATAVTGIQGSTLVGANNPCGTRVSVARYQPLAVSDPTGVLLVDTLNRELMHGAMSPAMRTQILNAVQAVTVNDAGLKKTRTAIYLIMSSSQYQVQR